MNCEITIHHDNDTEATTRCKLLEYDQRIDNELAPGIGQLAYKEVTHTTARFNIDEGAVAIAQHVTLRGKRLRVTAISQKDGELHDIVTATRKETL